MNYLSDGGCRMLILEREYISAETEEAALRQSQWQPGDKIGSCTIAAVHADLIGYQLYRVWPEFRDMERAAIEFVTVTQYVGV